MTNPVSRDSISELVRNIFIVMGVCLLPACIGLAQKGDTPAKQQLRVLYIGGDDEVLGGPGSARAADFERFLKLNFSEVETVKGADFAPELAGNADVIIKDAPIPIVLPPTFRKPIVMIGSNGLREIDRTGTKISLLCECLREKLHDIRLDHPIFHGPLPVVPTITEETDPYTGELVGMWKVHEKLEDPGLVAPIEQFLEADDSEIISGGINLKGDHGVALVREANLFLWGPIASPRYLTDEAARVLVNTIVYMKQFDGAKQAVWRGMSGRHEFEQVLATKDLKRMLSPETAYQRFLPSLIDKYGAEIDKYRAYYVPNLAYVRQPHGSVWFEIDQDAKVLGIPNNDSRLLEESIQMLQDPAKSEVATRVLRRYTGLTLRDVTDWQAWLAQNKEKLYFSDSYDYRFFTGAAGPSPTAKSVRTAINAMSLAEPSDVMPVSVGSTVATYFHSKEGNFSKKGALMTLVIRLNIAEGWHVYAQVPTDVPYKPTTVDAQLPEKFRWNGDWLTPVPKPGDVRGLTEFQGDVILTRQVYSVSPTKSAKIRGRVHFQVCNVEKCMPAQDAPFEVPITVYEN